jgi:hypothetical protein
MTWGSLLGAGADRVVERGGPSQLHSGTAASEQLLDLSAGVLEQAGTRLLIGCRQ